MEIDGLLLCSECENQLRVYEYEGGNGFLAVEPCVHCATQEISQGKVQQSIDKTTEATEAIQ